VAARRIGIAAVLLLALAAGVLVWRSRSNGPPGSGAGCNVILISIDTLRADRLGCYGHPDQATPNIDRLAADGVLFEQCTSSCPITLPSHSSMLTGTHPFVHGARDNGEFHLHGDNLSLAEVLRQNGYATCAEIAAFVLNREFGLHQGFDVYDDVPSGGQAAGVPERTAEEVCSGAIRLLEEHADGPFFLFVHFFDPHYAYQPPARFAARYPDPYVGEIAYADEQVGRLLGEVDRLGLAGRTLVILTGDHGEGLGQHGEQTHGTFLYDATLAVPLIVRCPGRIPAGRRVAAQVRLVDIAPTVLAFLELPPLPDAQGADLSPLLDGTAVDLGLAAFSESMMSRYNWGYAPLWALRAGGWKYVHAPRPQLYQVQVDPGEEHDLAAREPERLAEMRETLRQIIAEAPQVTGAGAGQRQVTAQDVEHLESLGYVGSGAAPPGGEDTNELTLFGAAGLDPHDHAEEIALTSVAMQRMNVGDFAEAERLLRSLLERYGEGATLHWAHKNLGFVLSRRGAHAEAVRYYREALGFRPEDARTLTRCAMSLTELDRLDEALAVFDRAVRIRPALAQTFDSHGVALHRAGRVDEAIEQFRRALELEPENGTTCGRLARVLLGEGRIDEALAVLEEGLDAAPDDQGLRRMLTGVLEQQRRADEALSRLAAMVERQPRRTALRLELAELLLRRGRPAEAEAQCRKAVELEPGSARAWHALAFVQLRQGGQADALKAFEAAVQREPNAVTLTNDLAWLLATSPDSTVRDGARAMRLVEAIRQHKGPARANVLDTLAAALAELGRFEEAVEVAGRAIEAARQSGNEDLVRRLGERRELYRSGSPYRMSP